MIKRDKKLLIFYILDILKKYTDDNHSLTYSKISEKLKQDCNFTPDPKTISRTISSLISYGADIKKHGNNGCSVVGNKFDSSELLFLIDAIFSSHSISSNHTKLLIKNLMSDCSIYERKSIITLKADETARSKKHEFIFTVNTISLAIESNKQISFNYTEVLPNKKLSARFDGKEFLINPYFMINNHGKYYLVCNYDKYNTLANYKIECISNIKILNSPIKPMSKLDDTENFDIIDYVNEHIYMFSGKTIQAVIKLDNAKTINDIIDWYGENISIKEHDDGIYVSFAVNEQAFLYWALQYGESIEIIKPIKTRNKYIEIIENIMKKYVKEGKNA